ncbi:MAG: NTPase [Acidiferrobacterales bacterium]
MISRSQHVLLLTGAPGVGKTTVIRRVADSLAGRRLAGFYTEEIRADGSRQGFRLTTFDGREIVMAHVDLPKHDRLGKYGVDVAAIDNIVEKALRLDEEPDIYLIDEIGKMECLSERFVRAVRQILDYKKPVVATVSQQGAGLIAAVKRRQDTELWEVTRANRDELAAAIVAWLGFGR